MHANAKNVLSGNSAYTGFIINILLCLMEAPVACEVIGSPLFNRPDMTEILLKGHKIVHSSVILSN